MKSKSDHNTEIKARVENLFGVQIMLMRIAGQMDPVLEYWFPNKLKIIGIIAGKAYRIFTVLITLHLAILFAITALRQLRTGQIEDIVNALTSFIIYAFAAFASIYWIRLSRELCLFFDRINSRYEYESLTGLTKMNARRPYEFAKRLSKCWQFAGILGVFFVAFTPMLTSERSLPLKCWYPFDVKAKYIYELTYFFQFLAHFEMGTVYSNGSTIYVSLILILLGQYDILFCSLKNIQSHSKLLMGKDIKLLRIWEKRLNSEDDEVNQYIICKEINVHLKEYSQYENSTENLFKPVLQYSMKQCLLHHQFILKSCKKLEELFSPFCLVKSMQMTAQLCLLVFVTVVAERSIVGSLNQLGYVVLTLVELFMFAFFGELLKTHSLRGGEALLRSPWQNDTHLIKNEILIFLENSKKPVQLTAGKLFAMDIERLRSVITQAFSFYTLLQKLASKKT